MARLTGLAAAAILGLMAGSASAQGLSAPVRQQAGLTLGGIQGIVIDDHGGPIADAMVSALGLTSAMATTDARGHFVIQPLPSGQYVLRINHAGYVSTRREGVRVGTSNAEVDRIQMRRAGAPDGDPLEARPILAAGVAALPPGDNASGDGGDNHSETAWRLRHVKRSVLKDDGSTVTIADAAADQTIPDEPASPWTASFGRAFDNAASVAANFFTATPFSGEVNLLTTSSQAATAPLLFSDFAPRGIAYLSIGAPAASGRWDVRASMSQSDVSAWIVAGTFRTRIATAHDSAFGVSYSTQQYQNPEARALGLGRAADDSRNVGEIYGSDRWIVSPTLAVDYGARYAHYDYLRQRSLLSPRAGVTLTPLDAGTHLEVHVAQRMLAPGAEEFLAPSLVGPWLPPERTFASLDGQPLRVERSRMLDVGLNHQFDDAYIVGVRRFQQRVDNQLLTVFGVPVEGGPQSPGHYFVGTAGAFDAEGWVFSLASAPSRAVHGSVEYTVSRADWISRGDMAAIALVAPAAIRPVSEDVRDLTTSLETDLPRTATRIFVLYRFANAYANATDPTRPAIDYRFDVQVNQALPFMPFSGTARWEVLVGLRNMFRDPTEAGSVYDELLVVRPPKRIIGGVLIRF
jgi:hypothetical protein